MTKRVREIERAEQYKDGRKLKLSVEIQQAFINDPCIARVHTKHSKFENASLYLCPHKINSTM